MTASPPVEHVCENAPRTRPVWYLGGSFMRWRCASCGRPIPERRAVTIARIWRSLFTLGVTLFCIGGLSFTAWVYFTEYFEPLHLIVAGLGLAFAACIIMTWWANATMNEAGE